MAGTEGMGGRTVVITGGNTGIGKEAAVALASRGATVVVTARDRAKGEAAVVEIAARSGRDDVGLVDLDLASLASVHRAAADVLDRFPRLDVLVNNAGLMLSHRLTTDEGFEMTLGVNHLGPFLLTTLLLDRLGESAPARIVNVSSIAHWWAIGGMAWDDMQFEHGFNGGQAYARSKLANVLFTRELALRLAGRGITANALHPGFVRSGFGQDGDIAGVSRLGLSLARPFLVSSAVGARTTVYLASSPTVAQATGGYYARCRRRPTAPWARNTEAARRLWETSERLVANGS